MQFSSLSPISACAFIYIPFVVVEVFVFVPFVCFLPSFLPSCYEERLSSSPPLICLDSRKLDYIAYYSITSAFDTNKNTGDPLYVGMDITIASFDAISEVNMVSLFPPSFLFFFQVFQVFFYSAFIVDFRRRRRLRRIRSSRISSRLADGSCTL